MARNRNREEMPPKGKLGADTATPEWEKLDIPYEAFRTSFLNELYQVVGGSDNSFSHEPVKIIKSGNATVVFWHDGTKTIVRCSADTIPNDYNAFTAALAIKIFGSNTQLKKVIAEKAVSQKPKKSKGEPILEGGVEA